LTALFAMQTDVIAIAILSVRPSVRLSVKFRCFVHINEDTIVWFLVSSEKIIVVSGKVNFIRVFARHRPSDGVKVKHPPFASENMTSNQP